MVALELERRSRNMRWSVTSIAAHRGISRTDLIPNGSGPRSFAGVMRTCLWFLFQPAARGALPTLFAATDPNALGGAYYGPDKFTETRGALRLAKAPRQALDTGAGARLWYAANELTGAYFDIIKSN